MPSTPTAHPRRRTRRLRFRPAAFALLLVVAPSVFAGPKDKCTCADMSEIRKELTDFETKRDMHKGKAAELEPQENKIIKHYGRAAADSEEMSELRSDYNKWEKQLESDAVTDLSDASAGATHFDEKTCEPDQKALQKMMQRSACLELASIVSEHENYHHDVCCARWRKCTTRRTNLVIEQDMVTRGREYGAPSSTAREEAVAYDGMVRSLNALIDKLKSKCKKKGFRGVRLMHRVPGGFTIQRDITGSNCGEPVPGNWEIVETQTFINVPQGAPLPHTKTERPWFTDCLLDGSDQAKKREQLILNSPSRYGAWYLIYQPAVGTGSAKINLRLPKLQLPDGVSLDSDHDHIVDLVDEGECKASEPKPSPPVPVS